MYFSRQVWTTWWVSSRDILRATVEVSNQLFCNSSPSIHQIHAFWEKRLLCGWSLKSCSYVKKQAEVIPSWWQVSVNVICSLLSSIRSFENLIIWSFEWLIAWLFVGKQWQVEFFALLYAVTQRIRYYNPQE